MTNSVLVEFLGDSPMVRLLDYLLTERDFDFSITDLANNAGVGRSTLYRLWQQLHNNNILLPTRTVGKAKLFRLHTHHPAIQKLIEMESVLIRQELQKKSIKNHKRV